MDEAGTRSFDSECECGSGTITGGSLERIPGTNTVD